MAGELERGKPTRKISFRIDEESYAQLQWLMKFLDMDQSFAIRHCIEGEVNSLFSSVYGHWPWEDDRGWGRAGVDAGTNTTNAKDQSN